MLILCLFGYVKTYVPLFLFNVLTLRSYARLQTTRFVFVVN